MSLSGHEILITGASGYLGQMLKAQLESVGANPRVIGHKLSELAGCDFSNIGTVVHLAAPSASDLVSNAQATLAHFDNFNESLFDACAKGKVEKLLIASSVRVYGEHLHGVVTESSRVYDSNPYAKSKLDLEARALQHSSAHGTETLTFRIANTFGYLNSMGLQKGRSLFGNDVCRQAAERGEISLVSNPLIRRDFISARYVTQILMHFATSSTTGKVYSIFNVASGTSLSLLEFAGKVITARERLFGLTTKLVLKEDLVKNVSNFQMSNNALAELFMGEPINLDLEIENTLRALERSF